MHHHDPRLFATTGHNELFNSVAVDSTSNFGSLPSIHLRISQYNTVYTWYTFRDIAVQYYSIPGIYLEIYHNTILLYTWYTFRDITIQYYSIPGIYLEIYHNTILLYTLYTFRDITVLPSLVPICSKTPRSLSWVLRISTIIRSVIQFSICIVHGMTMWTLLCPWLTRNTWGCYRYVAMVTAPI